ncbi:EpsG family protein [Sphingobacterium endophyticum]|uniref:EpsG family protein n=1 Tax=Sphingobacterium endophyticum TaxID=2546448 RepID=UPI0012E1A763|nr:EpsG family protein [Sphingobacterium endophyticum]
MGEIELNFLKELYLTILVALMLMFVVGFNVYVNKFKRCQFIKYTLTYTLAFFIALMFGFRDVEVGVDTKTYKYLYEYVFSPMSNFEFRKDILWDSINFLFSRFTDDITYLFVLVSFGYLFLPLFGVQKVLKENVIYFFLFFLISPNFFLYGANGIRNGLAASLFIFSFKYFKNYKQFLLLIISALIHASMIIPATFLLLSKYIKNIKIVYFVWVVLLILSALGVDFLRMVPLGLDRLGNYVEGSNELETSKIFNVPVNFLVYSISPIVISFYFIVIKKVYDEFFYSISITYLLSSCIYIAAFHANFAVRFAYLSEFLMPLVIIYPLFRFKSIKYVEIYTSLFLLVVFLIKSYKILSV